MELLHDLFFGNDAFWGGGVAHSVLILALVISAGIALGKLKIAGVKLGVTWILFVGIAVSHFGMRLEGHLIHFVKEFGLILFVYSIGLQVGPSFFSSFKKGGVTLNMLAVAIVFLGVIVTYVLYLITGLPITTMVGILSGAVTNTPGLGAAQQAYSDMTGIDSPDTAMGYAVAYPLGVVGIILSMMAIRRIFRIRFDEENKAMTDWEQGGSSREAVRISVSVKNPFVDRKTVLQIKRLINRQFIISRVLHENGHIDIANAQTPLTVGDRVLIVTTTDNIDFIVDFIGDRIDMDKEEWERLDHQFISRRIMITKSKLNGKHIGELKLRSGYGVTVTRVNRAGVDLIPNHGLQLQMGDRVTVVGSEASINAVSKILGNSMRRLNEPNLIPIFVGIFLGVVLGSIPIMFPGIPQPVKLGLAGGPLVVSILISRFGPHYKLVTYTTMSANLMLREVGISLFLACVGLGAGEGFIETVVYEGGYRWIGYGALITILPLMIVGIFARKVLKINYYTLMGLSAGAMTDPPALAYSNGVAGNDMPSVGYATVYPLTMFLRILTAQLLILCVA
ncbi:putative transporter [uncultured Alistipes sp.]|uniref:putative transporter n=1 Tax=uncultured Alistipes sp. TaxID=538949 RepID=UPI0026070F2F|nr:putative transporter [uncultured Alistipes sp.]